MKFYDCLTAPSPRRVRMLIAEKGINLTTVFVDLAKGEHMTEAFGAINPNRTVPVLELDDGTTFLDSNSISIFLDETFPETNFTGKTPTERALVAMWQREADLNGMGAIAECFRNSSKGFKNRALTGAVDYAQIPELAERGRQRVRQFFADIDARLQGREFLAIDRLSIADITAFVSVEFARAIKETVPETAVNLKRWREHIAQRPSSKM
jgi:glutathione S-transferase